jgi:hypothetical protein
MGAPPPLQSSRFQVHEQSNTQVLACALKVAGKHSSSCPKNTTLLSASPGQAWVSLAQRNRSMSSSWSKTRGTSLPPGREAPGQSWALSATAGTHTDTKRPKKSISLCCVTSRSQGNLAAQIAASAFHGA